MNIEYSIDQFYKETDPAAIVRSLDRYAPAYLWRPAWGTFAYETVGGITKVFDNGTVAIYAVRQ